MCSWCVTKSEPQAMRCAGIRNNANACEPFTVRCGVAHCFSGNRRKKRVSSRTVGNDCKSSIWHSPLRLLHRTATRTNKLLVFQAKPTDTRVYVRSDCNSSMAILENVRVIGFPLPWRVAGDGVIGTSKWTQRICKSDSFRVLFGANSALLYIA